jgi:hypothetical protein
MQPGEINLIEINYAPWTLPLGGPGLINGGFEHYVTHDESGCASGVINGFAAPSNTNYQLVLDPDEAAFLVIDLTTNEGPIDPLNTMTYSIVPLSGPLYGTLSDFDANGQVTYTPGSNYRGADYFAYQMCDPEGRCIIRTVQVTTTTTVGDANQNANQDPGRLSLVPYVYSDKAMVDSRLQTVRFPVYMPLSCRPCDQYRLTIRMRARDCDAIVYQHLSCYDFRCRNCG